MRILYLHQFFKTREGAGGTRSYELARHMVSKGHEVVMVTAPAAGSPRRRRIDGIDVVEVGGATSDYAAATSRGYGRRMTGFAGFAAGAAAAALRTARPDVVFATSPPLTVALPGIAAAKRHRVPLVFEVRDLWPEAPIQMGALPNPLMQRAARTLERGVYRSAAQVVALSPGMRDGVIAAGVAPERVKLVPNACDLDLFTPALDPGNLRAELGVERAFVASYFGTMGEANDLSQVVEAAAVLSRLGEEGIAFVLQGEGKRRATIVADVRRRGLDNVTVLPAADKLATARLAAASDACMTIFKDVPILATNSPNKLFDTFAAGRPAIVNTDGWQRELVERHDAGVYARAGDPADLAGKVLWLRDHPDRVAEMGVNARALAETQFDRGVLADRLLGVLAAAAA